MTLIYNLKLSLWWLSIALVAAYALQLFVGDTATKLETMHFHLQARPAVLYGHILGSVLALMAMSIQFLATVRARFPAVHRWLGRLYGAGILIGGLCGLTLALSTQSSPVAATGFAVLAVLWLAITGRAIVLIRSGQVAAHRRWMILSAALTFAAVTLRLELVVLQVSGLSFEIAYMIVAWACWVPNLLVGLWLVRPRPAALPA